MTYSTNEASDPVNFQYLLEKGGESHQQQVLVNNIDLPVECDDWEKLESWGVCRGEQTDPLFVSCTLPEGWTKVATEHSMWSELRDNNGLVHASIFYKGAFYDRKAHMDVIMDRYCVSRNYDIKQGIAYEIRDLATKTTLKQYPAGYWGYIVEDGEKAVGLVYEDVFHYKPTRDYNIARFSSTCSVKQVTQITYDDFYKDFHHVGDGQFNAISAAKHLAKQQALEECEHMNKESGW